MRIALEVEYNGFGFYGWQWQENLPTIQGELQSALSKIANHAVEVCCAGRTDAGVHATGQVVHFDTSAERVMRAWVFGANAYLPSTIAVRSAVIAADDFHARYSAIARCYRYVIYCYPARPAILADRVAWHYGVLDTAAMQQAGNYLIGENDFSAFRSAQCEAKTPMRNLQSLMIRREGDYIMIDVKANAFLHHMVRNIVGSLIEIGTGRKPPEWIKHVLASKDRRQAAATAPASGLYLMKVVY